MKRLGWSCALLLLGGATLAAFREPQGEPRLSAGEKAPQIFYGRRAIPSDADPYVLRDLGLDELRSRLRAAADKPTGSEARRAAYTLLLWQIHAILSLEDEDIRGDLYQAAESLYLSLLGEAVRPEERDSRLESNASFLIAAAWIGWKGSLDTLARERLKKSAGLREGQYRVAAEMMAEKTPFRPGLDGAVAKLLEGDAAAALALVDEFLKKKSDDASAQYWRGVALLQLKRPLDAIAPLDACLLAHPRDQAALEARAACRTALKDWTKALEDWEAALAVDPAARGRLQPFIEAIREASR